MDVRRRMVGFAFLSAFFLLFFNQGCTTNIISPPVPWEKRDLTGSIIRDYKVAPEHINLLQFYLSGRIVLAPDGAKQYEYYDHGLKLGDIEKGRIIFRHGLEGRHIRHEERETGFLKWKKKKMTFIIHFEEPPMNLKFVENDAGYLILASTKKKNKYFVSFEGRDYQCIEGHDARLIIDTANLAAVVEKDRYINGAPYPRQVHQSPNGPTHTGGLIFGVIGMSFLIYYLDRNLD